MLAGRLGCASTSCLCTMLAIPSQVLPIASTSYASAPPHYTCRAASSSSSSQDDILPTYEADHPPPYFPKTPLEPWLEVVRRRNWETTDLCMFTAPDEKPWSRVYEQLSASLREWGLPTDPNEHVRDAIRDPFGWCDVTERDVVFVDASFPSKLANTVLSMRPHEHTVVMEVMPFFSPTLLQAVAETAILGTYRHQHALRPLRFHIPLSSSDPHDNGQYSADWVLAHLNLDCTPWSLSEPLSATLGKLLIRQGDYVRLVKALFLVQARRKWIADAQATIAARKRNPVWRWRHDWVVRQKL